MLLLASVIVHDLVANGRVHGAIIWGEWLIGLTTFAGVAVGFSDFGNAFVQSFGFHK